MSKEIPPQAKRLNIVINELINGNHVKNKTELSKLLKTQLNVVNDFLSGKRPFSLLYMKRLEAAFPFVDVNFIGRGKGSWNKQGVKPAAIKNNISASDDALRMKINFLEEKLKDKERIISLLEKMVGK